MQVVLEHLGQALVEREPSSADWRELEASACQYRDLVSSGEDAQLSFHKDAQMVTVLLISSLCFAAAHCTHKHATSVDALLASAYVSCFA